MLDQTNPKPFENYLIDSFFESTTTEEVTQHLDQLLDVYLQNAEVSRVDLANAVNMNKRLERFLISLYTKLNKEKAEKAITSPVAAN